jgi:hypothetical protein
MDIPQAGSITGLVGLLWSIFRVIEKKLPSPHNNLREDIDGLVSRVKELEGNKAERADIKRLELRIQYAEDDITRLQRGRGHA